MAIEIESMDFNWYDVVIRKGGEVVEDTSMYGDMENVVYTMDSLLGDFEDWSELDATISFRGLDLVHMPCLTGPDYEVVVRDKDFERMCISVDLNNFMYDYDPHEYRDSCESMGWGIERMYRKMLDGDESDIIEGLQGIFDESGEQEALDLIRRVEAAA